MKRNFVLLLVYLLAIAPVLGQDVLYTTKGDTIQGRITIFTTRQGAEQIDIKVNKKKHQYKLVDVKEYRQKGEVYKTIFAQGRYKIGKVISEGYLSLYYFTPTAYEKRPPFSQILLSKENGNQMELPKSLMFKKSVADFLKDCPSVAEKVLDKTYGRGDINEIVREYNLCFAQQKQNGINTESFEAKLSELRKKLQFSRKVENKKAVRQMLKDFEEKSRTKEEIPSYLTDALTEALKDDLELSSLLKDILKN